MPFSGQSARVTFGSHFFVPSDRNFTKARLRQLAIAPNTATPALMPAAGVAGTVTTIADRAAARSCRRCGGGTGRLRALNSAVRLPPASGKASLHGAAPRHGLDIICDGGRCQCERADRDQKLCHGFLSFI
jgi:hypothetical protein